MERGHAKLPFIDEWSALGQGNWGMLFRRGHLEVPLNDFEKIAAAMGVTFEDDVQLVASEEEEKQFLPLTSKRR